MVDIIIPVYNSLNTLGRTLDSIMEQTYYKIVDVYIIDDCSDCNYDELLDKYKDLRIHYHRIDVNGGPGVAREKGINISSNKYIMFIDSDDYFNEDFSVELLFNEIDDNDLDYVNAQTYSEKSKTFYFNDADLHSKIYRREFIIKNDLHFNNTRYHEDNLFNNMVLACNPRARFLEFILYYYSCNKNSLTNNEDYDEFNKFEILISNTKEFLDETKKRNCNREIVLRLLASKIIYFNRILFRFSESQIEQLKSWLDKYDIKLKQYLGNDDFLFITEDIINNYDY